MPDVTSSVIRRVTYDDATHALAIGFANGRTYRYLDVPKTEYEKLLEAESKGSFFNARIRDSYDFQFVADWAGLH